MSFLYNFINFDKFLNFNNSKAILLKANLTSQSFRIQRWITFLTIELTTREILGWLLKVHFFVFGKTFRKLFLILLWKPIWETLTVLSSFSISGQREGFWWSYSNFLAQSKTVCLLKVALKLKGSLGFFLKPPWGDPQRP